MHSIVKCYTQELQGYGILIYRVFTDSGNVECAGPIKDYQVIMHKRQLIILNMFIHNEVPNLYIEELLLTKVPRLFPNWFIKTFIDYTSLDLHLKFEPFSSETNYCF